MNGIVKFTAGDWWFAISSDYTKPPIIWMLSKERVVKSLFVGNQRFVIERFCDINHSRAQESPPTAPHPHTSHTDLAFTHKTLAFSFACFCRHCPIKLHQLKSFLMLTLIANCLLAALQLFLLFPPLLLRSFLSVPLFSSVLRSSLSQSITSQALGRWFLDESPVCLIPSGPLCLHLIPSLCCCSFIVSLFLKGQRREWQYLNMNSFPFTFPACFPLPLLI